jgi:hypothetical protein
MGMFYCPAKQFGDIGILRQPIGFEDEEWNVQKPRT